jgi:hypothetical protein
MKPKRISVENVNHPGQVTNLDADKYVDMKRALLEILPGMPPGLTVAEIRERLHGHLSEEHFPDGAKAGWWLKAVQLDLEAKGIIARQKVSPIRLYATGARR